MCIPRGFYNSCKFILAASLFSFCAALASPAQQIDVNENGEDEDLQAARSQWFYEQRAYPQGYIPSGARLNALQQMDRMQSLQQQGLSGVADLGVLRGAGFGTRWTLVGPRPESIPDNAPPFLGTANVSGRVTALALDPRGSIYLGSAVGGAWKSYNRGTVWLPLMSQQESLAIGSLAIDPNTPNTVYAGTGENEFGAPSYYGAGILKSDTAGFFWTLLGQDVFAGPFGANGDQGGAYIAAVDISHKDGNILLAAVTFFDDDAHSGIYRSTDGGATWSDDPLNPRKPVLAGAAGCEVFFDRRDATGNTVYAALGTPSGSAKNGIYVSKDALPHLGNGISGNAFQSPFASPPGVGLSSSMVNVLWGLFNLAVGYVLVCRVGSFNLRKTQHALVLGAGILIMSLMLAHTFGRLHGGL